MRNATFIMVLAAPALLAGNAFANDYECTEDVQGGYFDNIEVPYGAVCRLFETKVGGNIYVEKGGALKTLDTKVEGNIQAYGAKWVRIDWTYVGGDVQIEATKRMGSKVKKSWVHGNIQVENNYVPFVIYWNYVGGNVQFNKNKDDRFVIAKNRIKGNLQCYANSPKPEGGKNKVYGDAEGQCYNLAYSK